MIRVSDYIVKYLEGRGVKDVFMISGGGAMFLNDSFGHSKIKYICSHNEQASAISAEGYARVKQDLAVTCVTTGPGGINALNGVFGQWTDSVAALYISGQVKLSTTTAACPNLPLRQLGDQEADIISLVSPITKYAKMVTNPQEIKYHLQRALYTAATGRPGPVWLDIPLNVQSAMVDERKLKGFKPKKEAKPNLKITQVLNILNKARRPLIVAGHGVRLAGAQADFNKLIKTFGAPVTTTFNGFDLIPDNNPCFAGRIGTVGQRAGNFALQNADAVLFLGTRNNIRQVSYNYENFAKNAKKIVVDIDAAELKKPTLRPDLAINADVRAFLKALNAKAKPLGKKEWLKWCKERVAAYPPMREFEIKPAAKVNPYYFTNTLTKLLPADNIVVASNATACLTMYQAGEVKKGQRMFLNSGNASMGYGLPAAIGAAVNGGGKQTVICLEGDGSIMMNLQELQTVKSYNLPVKIIIFNNNGYSSIKQTQQNFFKRLSACGVNCGVTMPHFLKLAKAFGLPAMRVSKNANVTAEIKKMLKTPGPLIFEVICEEDYIFKPKLSARTLQDGSIVSPSLEDMYPFLPQAELKENTLK